MIEDLARLATILVIVGVTVGLGSLILGEIGNVSEIQSDSDAQDALSKSKQGISNLGTFLPIIGLVIGAIVVLRIIKIL